MLRILLGAADPVPTAPVRNRTWAGPWRVVSNLLTAALFAGPIPLASAESPVAGRPPVGVSFAEPCTESQPMSDENPFFSPSPLPFEAPDFSRITNDHFRPAFARGMADQMAEIQQIANATAAPTFANTIEAMERTGEILTRVQRVFFNLSSAHTSPEIQQIQVELAPKLAAHADNILLDPQLFARVQTIWNQREQLDLDPEQQRLLKETYERFVRAGAMLSADQQAKIRAINERLSSLSTEFQNNLLAITKQRSLLIEDVAQLEGLSADQIAGAAQQAKQRGEDGKYLLTITNTTRQPILASLQRRDLRQRLWEASAYRGLGRDGGLDNRAIVLELADLRAQKAKLLGYANHAAYALEPAMAKEPTAAIKMLTDMVPAVVQKAQAEAADIAQLMQADGIDDQVQPWDWEYYAEKVRAQKYDLDDAEVRQYFLLDNVLKNGVFYTMNRLFGVQFVERFDIPVYHEDVRVFDVIDADGAPIGLFYADYFERETKRGGAWMSSFVGQSGLLDKKPVIVNVMNIPKPAPGDPALISFDHASTMFHEMGHAVHGLFSAVKYPSLAGTAVPRDFVEFPSTFQEDWAIHPEVLQNYAKHYQTGEVLPPALLERMIAAKTFNQGYDTLEYLSSALLDLEWHALSPNDIPQDMEQFEAQVLERCGVWVNAVPPRYKTAFFAHVWPGGYAASYYAYMWSEVLAADSYAWIQANQGLSRQSGDRFRNTVLSRGGSVEPMQQYQDFIGREPQVEALLIRRGLK